MKHSGGIHFQRARTVRQGGRSDGCVMAGSSIVFGTKSYLARVLGRGILICREAQQQRQAP
jgi:hypothetical protein